MTDDSPPRDWITVNDPAAARALGDPALRRVLMPFLETERRVSEVAAELGMDKNALLLRVQRLTRLGLLRITREVPRAGRAIKLYRAVAAGFFVPYHAVIHATPEDWLLAEYAGGERALARATMRAGTDWAAARGRGGFGQRFYRRADSVLEADFGFSMHEGADLDEAEAPAVMSALVSTHLDFESAKRLQGELLDLVRRYERPGAGRAYLLRLGLAPLGG